MALNPDEAERLLTSRLEELKREDALGEQAAAPVTLEQDSVGRLSRIDAMQLQAMALAAQRRRESRAEPDPRRASPAARGRIRVLPFVRRGNRRGAVAA